ncbi:MAG: diaminopimelate epimerase [Anaerolineae bacterium]
MASCWARCRRTAASFGLRIFNPDGSEAEKSGNGLRIFARYLWDRGLVDERPFSVATAGGLVTAQVESGGRMATVAMGRVSFDSQEIPVAGPRREALNETLHAGDTALRCCAATLGNPHCVVLREEVSAADAQRLGPLIETDARFPRRTNVQFMQVLDRGRVRIEIWERGAGYTLASGSSACAAAAVAHRLGLCDAQVTVSMPGGRLEVGIAPDWTVTLHGACHQGLVKVFCSRRHSTHEFPCARAHRRSRRRPARWPRSTCGPGRWAIAACCLTACWTAFPRLYGCRAGKNGWPARANRFGWPSWMARSPAGWSSAPSAIQDVDAQRVGEIYALYVHPEFWRHGCGAALGRARAKEELLSQGLAEITLWVLRSNQRARSFLRGAGLPARRRQQDRTQPRRRGLRRGALSCEA